MEIAAEECLNAGMLGIFSLGSHYAQFSNFGVISSFQGAPKWKEEYGGFGDFGVCFVVVLEAGSLACGPTTGGQGVQPASSCGTVQMDAVWGRRQKLTRTSGDLAPGSPLLRVMVESSDYPAAAQRGYRCCVREQWEKHAIPVQSLPSQAC